MDRLLKLILAAVGNQRLVASGEYMGADAEADSVGTGCISLWSSALFVVIIDVSHTFLLHQPCEC